MAEGIMKKLIQIHQLNWQVDSAGIESYHIGEQPDRRALLQCKQAGIDITWKRARRFTQDDFARFDMIYALDTEVFDVLEELRPNTFTRLLLLMDEVFPGQQQSVPDPWYGTQKDFAKAFQMIEQACIAILRNYAGVATHTPSFN